MVYAYTMFESVFDAIDQMNTDDNSTVFPMFNSINCKQHDLY